MINRLAERPHVCAGLVSHDDLLRPERDQHADDDNPDLARELSPAVQRFGKVKVHFSALS